MQTRQSMRTTLLLVLAGFSVASLFAGAGCTAGKEDSATSDSKPETGASTPTATGGAGSGDRPAPEAPPPGTDLTKVTACEVFTKDEVVKLVGASKLVQEPNDLSAEMHPACRYHVEWSDGNTDAFMIGFMPAAEWTALMGAMTNEERGESVPGSWEQAWYGKYALGEGNELHVLKAGRYGFFVRCSADRKEACVKLAAEIVKRVD